MYQRNDANRYYSNQFRGINFETFLLKPDVSGNRSEFKFEDIFPTARRINIYQKIGPNRHSLYLFRKIDRQTVQKFQFKFEDFFLQPDGQTYISKWVGIII